MEQPDASQSNEPPRSLIAGKYRLTRLLGRGGMGTVWEGVHATLGTRVAVKLIETEHAQGGEARRRFEMEARAAAKLQSKHVVEVYDHGVTPEGHPFIVMQYLAGEALDQRLERVGRLPPEETARIVLQICRALVRAHSLGIVHRDLKPENVFLVRDEEDGTELVKVVDFGIAKLIDNPLESSSTNTGSVLGTPYYMSPEQARGLKSLDHRTDLWSVGVIAFRCLVGELPFRGEAVGDVLVNLCTGPIPIPSARAPDLPLEFDFWIDRALARAPEERFQNAQELSDALAKVCGLSARPQLLSMDAPFEARDSRHEVAMQQTNPAPARAPEPAATSSAGKRRRSEMDTFVSAAPPTAEGAPLDVGSPEPSSPEPSSLLGHTTTPTMRTPPPPAFPEEPPARRGLVVGLAAAAAAALALIFVLVRSHGGAAPATALGSGGPEGRPSVAPSAAPATATPATSLREQTTAPPASASGSARPEPATEPPPTPSAKTASTPPAGRKGASRAPNPRHAVPATTSPPSNLEIRLER